MRYLPVLGAASILAKYACPNRPVIALVSDGAMQMNGLAELGELMAEANTFAKRFPGSRYWPDRRWDLVLAIDDSSQRTPHYDQLLERASWFYEAVSFSAAMKSQTPGAGQAYLSCYTDRHGQWLDGGND